MIGDVPRTPTHADERGTSVSDVRVYRRANVKAERILPAKLALWAGRSLCAFAFASVHLRSVPDSLLNLDMLFTYVVLYKSIMKNEKRGFVSLAVWRFAHSIKNVSCEF